MFSTNDCVPGGTFPQWIAGDVPPPGSAPGADWVNFNGISLPSEKPETVSVIAGAAGRAAGWAAGADVCARAAAAITASRDNRDTIAKSVRFIVAPLAFGRRRIRDEPRRCRRKARSHSRRSAIIGSSLDARSAGMAAPTWSEQFRVEFAHPRRSDDETALSC